MQLLILTILNAEENSPTIEPLLRSSRWVLFFTVLPLRKSSVRLRQDQMQFVVIAMRTAVDLFCDKAMPVKLASRAEKE